VLARLVYRERLNVMQGIGVVVALGASVLLAVG
jgi:hypothetical protein